MPSKVEDVFASGAYWREYYTLLGHENREVGSFLFETTAPIARASGIRILDAGCGPTLLYWAVFVPGRNELHGFDLNPENIKANQRSIEDARRGVVDPGLVQAAAHAVRLAAGAQTPADLVAGKAGQVRSLTVADLTSAWPYESDTFDLVQSCFALESLPDWGSFDRALSQARRVLRPGGKLMIANAAHGKGWICDDRHFATLFVTAEEIRARIAAAGFALSSIRDIESSDVSWREQGYSRLLLTAATKAS